MFPGWKIIVTVSLQHGIHGGAEDMIAASVGTVSRWLVDFRTQRIISKNKFDNTYNFEVLSL